MATTPGGAGGVSSCRLWLPAALVVSLAARVSISFSVQAVRTRLAAASTRIGLLAGRETISSTAAMDMAVTAAAVRRIDTTDFAMPATEADVRLLLQELDFDGLKAAGEGLRQLHARPDDGTKASKN